MNKQQIHIKIENTTYLLLKSKGVNISNLANQLFKQYMEFETINIPEEIQLLKKLEESKNKIKEAEKEIEQYAVMLSKVRQDKEERIKQSHRDAHIKIEMAKRIARTLDI